MSLNSDETGTWSGDNGTITGSGTEWFLNGADIGVGNHSLIWSVFNQKCSSDSSNTIEVEEKSLPTVNASDNGVSPIVGLVNQPLSLSGLHTGTLLNGV